MAKKKKGKAGLTKKQLAQYNKLAKQVSRAKGEIRKDNKKFDYGQKAGKVNKSRSDRSKQYSKLTQANKELAEFRAKHGIGKEKEKPRVRRKGRTNAKKQQRILRTLTVWEFERSYLTKYITGGFYKYIVLNGEKVKIQGTPPSKILSKYDMARDMAYMKLLASTPMVDVTLDDKNKVITVEFLS